MQSRPEGELADQAIDAIRLHAAGKPLSTTRVELLRHLHSSNAVVAVDGILDGAPFSWILKRDAAGTDYEARVLELVQSLNTQLAIELVGTVRVAEHFWSITRAARPVVLPVTPADCTAALRALSCVHRLEPTRFAAALAPRFFAMTRATMAKQLERNLGVIEVALSPLTGIERARVERVGSLFRSTIDRLINARWRAPRCLIHGDATCDNWILLDNGRLGLADWELARLDDPLWDVQCVALAVAMPVDELLGIWADAAETAWSADLRSRFFAARAEYLLRITSWFAILTVRSDGAAADARAKLDGSPGREPAVALAERAFRALEEVMQELTPVLP